MRVVFPVLALSLITGPPAPEPPMSAFMNAERLIAHCDAGSELEPGMADVCIGYIAGSVDQIISRQLDLPPGRRTVCVPPAATLGDVQRAVLADLDAYRDQPNASAAAIIDRAVAEAFPC